MSLKQKKERPKRTRHQKRAGKTREKLLRAAKSVFSERGFDAVSIDEITERADLGKGTFYYHFGTKDQLIKELIRDVLGDLELAIRHKSQTSKDLYQLLDNIILAHIDFFDDRWEEFVLYFQGRSEMILDDGYEGLDRPFISYQKNIEELIDEMIETHLPKSKLRRIAYAITGFISGLYSFSLITTPDEDIHKTLNTMRSALVASLVRFIKEALPAVPSEIITGQK
jgi:AcrR family transcriptional regulator